MLKLPCERLKKDVQDVAVWYDHCHPQQQDGFFCGPATILKLASILHVADPFGEFLAASAGASVFKILRMERCDAHVTLPSNYAAALTQVHFLRTFT